MRPHLRRFFHAGVECCGTVSHQVVQSEARSQAVERFPRHPGAQRRHVHRLEDLRARERRLQGFPGSGTGDHGDAAYAGVACREIDQSGGKPQIFGGEAIATKGENEHRVTHCAYARDEAFHPAPPGVARVEFATCEVEFENRKPSGPHTRVEVALPELGREAPKEGIPSVTRVRHDRGAAATVHREDGDHPPDLRCATHRGPQEPERGQPGEVRQKPIGGEPRGLGSLDPSRRGPQPRGEDAGQWRRLRGRQVGDELRELGPQSFRRNTHELPDLRMARLQRFRYGQEQVLGTGEGVPEGRRMHVGGREEFRAACVQRQPAGRHDSRRGSDLLPQDRAQPRDIVAASRTPRSDRALGMMQQGEEHMAGLDRRVAEKPRFLLRPIEHPTSGCGEAKSHTGPTDSFEVMRLPRAPGVPRAILQQRGSPLSLQPPRPYVFPSARIVVPAEAPHRPAPPVRTRSISSSMDSFAAWSAPSRIPATRSRLSA